jgi:hypothetical protein
MEHWDEKIVSMLNGGTNGRPADNYGVMTEEAGPDITAPVVQIGDELHTFVETELLDGAMRMLLPQTFKPMSAEMARKKYPSEHRPGVIYTTSNARINIAVNHTLNPLPEEDLPEFKKAMIQMLRRTQKLTKWYGDNEFSLGGKPVATCEFLTPVLNASLYNLILFASLADRALMCTFNCTDEELDDWKPIALAMMKSIQFIPQEEGDESHE